MEIKVNFTKIKLTKKGKLKSKIEHGKSYIFFSMDDNYIVTAIFLKEFKTKHGLIKNAVYLSDKYVHRIDQFDYYTKKF